MSKVPQRDRVLSALRKGPLTQAAFDGPTIDGLPRLPQIARRIGDLRADGYEIDTIPSEDGGYCTYVLVAEPDVTHSPPHVGDSAAPLYDDGVTQVLCPRSAIDDDWDWEAA